MDLSEPPATLPDGTSRLLTEEWANCEVLWTVDCGPHSACGVYCTMAAMSRVLGDKRPATAKVQPDDFAPIDGISIAGIWRKWYVTSHHCALCIVHSVECRV